jgi:hypothetical protein
MKIEKNVIRSDNLIVNTSFLNNNIYNDQYCVYENELFCFNAHPFLEHYSDIKITQKMLLDTLHRAQQKAFQEIEENEMIAASSSI